MAENEGQETAGDLRSKLEESIKQNKALTDQLQGLAAVQLENAAFKAGLSLDDKKLRALFAVHEGDDYSPEALKATAEGLGFTSSESTKTETEAPPPPAGHTRIDAAASGSSAAGEKSWDDKFAEARTKGREATEAVINEYEAFKRGQVA